MSACNLSEMTKKAESLITSGKSNEALRLLNKAIADGLSDWKLYWLMAQAGKNIGNLEIVDIACKAVLELNPDFWFARELPKHARGYYSQLGQDEIVERFFAAHPPKSRVFVEVGAFDGVHYSNVRRLQETHGWSGVSIEPVGKNFEKLSKSYAGKPVACIRCAVGEKEGTAELNVSSYPHLPDWGSDVATLSESETTRRQQLYGAVWHKERIPVKTLTSVLRENQITTVDFLSVDAGGHDLDVLKGLDFSVYQPQMIVVEYNKHRQEIFDYLAARGYFLWLDNGQDLFMVAAQAIRIPTEQPLPEVINFNGSTGRQPYDEIQTAVEMGVHAFINAAVEDIRCFVIVGGYLGFEIERILRTYPNVEIHVFEPSHRYFRPLSERYAGNPRVFCHNLAVSDTNGTAVFHETSLEGTGSLLPMKQKRDHATWIPDGASVAEKYQVKTVRLDDFVPLADRNIDLLWCDVQGHELSVLKGATRVLRSCSAVFLEVAMYKTTYEGQCLFDELNTYLAANKFHLMGIGLCNSGNGTGNALWVSGARHQSTRNPAQQKETILAFDAIRSLVNPHLLAIDYLPKDKPITRRQLEPLALLTPPRFDIVPKFIYAEFREFGIDSSWGRELYEAHLRAFNDCYEGDGSSKSGIKAFIDAFNTLLDSIKENGFDPCQSLVPAGRNNVIIDGAHRVAACLLHRRPVDVLEFDLRANVYNYEFFLNRGLDADYCDAIALEYCRLNPHAYIVSVFPSAVGRELEIREILERNGEIFYARQVHLSRLGSVNLVRQMYDGEHWVGSFANRFEGAQIKAAECFRTDGPVRVYVVTSDDFEKVKAAKQQIRDLFGISNHSVHINDTHEETVRLGRLLLNANSVHFLNNAQLTTFPRFQSHLDNYKKVLREQGVDGECLCIDGSAVMAAYGIREARDLDYLHFSYDNLTFDYPPELIGSHNSEIAHHVTTRDDIIFNPRNHFYYDGVKFASLGIIRALKQKRGEPKDFDDVALIDRFVKTPPSPPNVYVPPPSLTGARQSSGANRRSKIVGLVPARNEKHTIAQCLRALSLFTDAIVYLDDASTDETPDIVESLARECSVERIIRKKEWYRDEPGDRNAMLRAGREIGGTHFIVIDADEMLTSNLLASPGLRDAILQLQPGDRLALNWIQLWRSIDQYRFDQSVWTWNYKDIIFCDDGRCSYSSEFIHTPRVPGNLSGNRYTIQGYEAGLLHFQFVNWRNLLVKQAWYRCLEHIREPEKPVTEINERYAPSKDESGLGLAPSPAAWFSGYPFFDRTVYDRPDEWREKQVRHWFKEYGEMYFSELDIWDVDWRSIKSSHKNPDESLPLQDQSFSITGNQYNVSAIVSTYKSEFFIRECLEDLINQTLHQLGKLEIIVIDSASPENEGAIVREFQHRSPHIRYIRTTERESLYAAWNRGIEMASGEYLTNANTDDRHRPDALEKMAHALDRHPEIALVYANCAVTSQKNGSHGNCPIHARFLWPDFNPSRLFQVCYVGPQPMWRKSLHSRYGLFDTRFVSAGDYDFWLRLVANGEHFLHLNEELGLYLQSNDGIEHSNQKLSQQESELARKKNWPKSWGKIPLAEGNYLCPLDMKGTDQIVGSTEIPLVSVIVPTFNRPIMLKRAINSILEQTLQTFEILVINDGGEDISPIVESFSSEKIKYLAHQTNKGRSATRNTGLLEARGKYIAYLDDDDIYYPEHLECLVNFLEKSDFFAAYTDAYCSIMEYKDGEYVLINKFIQHSSDFEFERLLVENFIPTLCLMHRRECLERTGFFDESLETHEDWDLWIRMSNLYPFAHLRMATCEFSRRLDGTSVTTGNLPSFLQTMQKIYAKHVEYSSKFTHVASKQQQNIAQLAEKVEIFVSERIRLIAHSMSKGDCDSALKMVETLALQVPQDSRVKHLMSSLASTSEHKGFSPSVTCCEKLKVAVYSLDHPEHACARIRVIAPAETLAESVELRWGVDLGTDQAGVNTKLIDWADLIIVQRFFPMANTALLLERILAAGKPVIYETDDLLVEVPATNPHQRGADAAKPYIFDLIAKAAAVTVSTEEMKRTFASHHRQIYVLPNLLDDRLWTVPLPVKPAGVPVVIGYAGTADHKADLRLLEEVLERIAAKYGSRVAFRFMGCDTERIKGLPGFSSITFEPGYANYARTIQKAGIDIGLVPLEDNRFNRCKSNIKWLEYSACGIAGIYADLPPYRSCVKDGETGILVNGYDVDAWVAAIESLIDNPDLRHAMALAARTEVLANYTLKSRGHLFLDTWRRIAGLSGTSKFKQEGMPPAPQPFAPHTAPTEVDAPQVSIIIPLYNKAEYTKQCLEALALNTEQALNYEVILVDNASSDGTAEYLRTLSGDVTIVTNLKNLGFAKACNQGGRIARGRYLVFLNNDTIPHPGWLDGLIRGAERDGADIVGARLLYPNGRVQHAGVAFNEQSIGYHIFNGFPADAPAVNRKRFMQCVTAACMLVKQGLFAELGGFDEGYVNGFEDVDFCLRAGERGRRILYTPESVLIHFEETSEGRKDHDTPNIRRFLARWEGKVRCDHQDIYRSEGYRAERQADGRLRIYQADAAPVSAAPTPPPAAASTAPQQITQTPGTGTAAATPSVSGREKALALKAEGRYVEAIEHLVKIVTSGDNSVLVDLGDCLASLEKYDDALALYEESLALCPTNVRALVGVGVVRYMTRRIAEAADAFSRALETDPADSKALCGLGMARCAQGRNAEGFELYGRALEAEPENLTAVHESVRLAYELGRFSEAARRIESYLRHHPGDIDILFACAGLLHMAGRNADARDALERLMVFSPEYSGAVELLAKLEGRDQQPGERVTEAEARRLKEDGKYEEALAAFSRAAEAGDSSALADMGDCLAQLGRLDEAAARYLEALDVDGTDLKALVGLGVVSLVQGKQVKAVTWFNRALKADPANAKALCGLGMVRNMQNKHDEAFGLLARAVDADPEGLTALHELIRLSYATGRFDEAGERLDRYLMHHPADLDMVFAQAGIRFKAGRYAEALSSIETVLLFASDYEGGLELREAITQAM